MCTDEFVCEEEDMAASSNGGRSSGSSGGEMEAFHGVASSLLVGELARGLACKSELENEGPICPDVPFSLSCDASGASPDGSALAAVDKRAALGIRGRSTGECLEDSSVVERVECRGFSLPRFCREKNAQEAGKRFGFVLSRRRRTLSLDDQSVLIKDSSPAASRDSKMKMMTSRDDSCIPFMTDCSMAQLKKELMSPSTTTILTKRRDLSSSNLSAERSMSFACHRGVGENQLHCREKQQHEESCYDLVGSPGPKFLLNVTLAEAFDSPLTPFKTAAAVPFKWEVAPGKPKPDAAAPKPEPSLQLPPRLLVRSLTAKHAEQQSSIISPDRQRQQRRAQSVNHRHGLLLGIRSAESPRHKSDSNGAEKHDPCSPTSILCGPESSSTSSSSDTLSVSDSECHVVRAPADPSSSVLVSDAESASLHQQHSPPSQAAATSSSCALGPAEWDSGLLGHKSSSLVDSIAKIFHLGRAKWARATTKKKKNHQEVQMWAPTLAAYFHSSSLDHERKGGDSGQLVLLEDPDTPRTTSDSLVASKSAASLCMEMESVRSNGLRVESDEGGSGEEGYCGCSSPRFAPFSPSSQLRSLKRGSGKQKKWVVRRIRRSSRLFQTFVFKAVKHAVQPRRKSPLDSSKLLYHSVQS